MTHQPETAASSGRREFLAALVLTGIAIAAFVAVFGLVNRFRTWQRHLADRLYSQGEQALKVTPEISEIELTMPNQHRLLVNLQPFGMDNPNEIFVTTDDPFGKISGTIARD